MNILPLKQKNNKMIQGVVVNELYKNTITDEDKITWFKFLNFAGTPQDVEHINNLNK